MNTYPKFTEARRDGASAVKYEGRVVPVELGRAPVDGVAEIAGLILDGLNDRDQHQD